VAEDVYRSKVDAKIEKVSAVVVGMVLMGVRGQSSAKESDGQGTN